jgi:hypothetical protein
MRLEPRNVDALPTIIPKFQVPNLKPNRVVGLDVNLIIMDRYGISTTYKMINKFDTRIEGLRGAIGLSE